MDIYIYINRQKVRPIDRYRREGGRKRERERERRCVQTIAASDINQSFARNQAMKSSLR